MRTASLKIRKEIAKIGKSIRENNNIGLLFKSTSVPGTIFQIIKWDENSDTIKYKVIEGGRIGQINTEPLQDFNYYLNRNENIFVNK